MKKKNLQNIITFAIIITIVITAIGFNLINQKNENTPLKTLKVTSKPFLWKIEGENTSYLYGIIHVKTQELLTLPDIVMNALNEVDTVYTETKLDDDSKIESLSSYFLPIGDLLENILPNDLIDRLNSYLTTKNLSLSRFNLYSPWAVAININSMEYQEYFLNPVLDQYIWNIATDEEKETNGLETIYAVTDIYNSMTIEEQIRYLNDTLTRVTINSETTKQSMESLIESYIQGDLETFWKITYNTYNNSDPFYENLFKKLIIDRNHNLSENISNIIKNNPDKKYFFAIGAAHYWGEEGIINLLEKDGFKITRVPFEECNCEKCDDGKEKINGRCYIEYSD